MAVGSSLSPVVSNVFMEYFKDMVLDMVKYKPLLWLCYVYDTSVVWPQTAGFLEAYQQFETHYSVYHGSGNK
jgi:hypothetical protein